MILDQIDTTTEMHSSNEVVTKEFGMDKDAMAIIFRGFSDSLYSNKIGSIVREITSNAFDAHAEVGVNKMVHVSVEEPDLLTSSSGYFTVEDFGVGLSPERINDTYTQYGASTKRDTNNEIGGFGIGAKSPLAYADSFILITRFNGTEYHYVIHRAESAPKIELVHKEATEHGNGTKVLIPIKNENDANRFRQEIRSQLRYFENIYYSGCGVSNEYTLYKGKTFVTNLSAPSLHQLHLCVGRVYYPLDLTYFDTPECIKDVNMYGNFWDLNLALFCNIGDISVTMSRESIEYTDKTISFIQKRLEEFAVEFESLIEGTKKETADLFEYLESDGARKILFTEDVYFNIPWEMEALTLTGLPQIEGLKWKLPKDPFFQYSNSGKYVDGKYVKASSRRFAAFKGEKVLNLLLEKRPAYRMRGTNQKRLSLYLQEIEGGSSLYFIERDDLTANDISLFLKPKHDVSCSNVEDKKKALAEAYDKYILEYLVKRTKSYEDSVIPEAWLKAYLKELKSLKSIKEDKEGKFNIKYLQTSYGGEIYYNIGSYSWKNLFGMLDSKRYIIYGGYNDKAEAEMLFNLLNLNRSWGQGFESRSALAFGVPFSFFLTSKDTAKQFQQIEHPNLVNFKQFRTTKLYKSTLKKVGVKLLLEELREFKASLTSFYPDNSKAVYAMNSLENSLSSYCKGVSSNMDAETYEIVKNSFDFYNTKFIMLNNNRVDLSKVISLVKGIKEHSPWAFVLKASSNDKSIYEPIINLIKSQVKSTLLYD